MTGRTTMARAPAEGSARTDTHRPRHACPCDRQHHHGVDAQTQDLFAYVEIDSQERWDAIAQTDTCRRWWRYMSELMPSAADHSPLSVPLREVFHL